MPKHVTGAVKIAGRGGAKPSAPKFKKTALGVSNASTNPDRKISNAKVRQKRAEPSSGTILTGTTYFEEMLLCITHVQA